LKGASVNDDARLGLYALIALIVVVCFVAWLVSKIV
jgi:flagellar biogenesis protein FliO